MLGQRENVICPGNTNIIKHNPYVIFGLFLCFHLSVHSIILQQGEFVMSHESF